MVASMVYLRNSDDFALEYKGCTFAFPLAMSIDPSPFSSIISLTCDALDLGDSVGIFIGSLAALTHLAVSRFIFNVDVHGSVMFFLEAPRLTFLCLGTVLLKNRDPTRRASDILLDALYHGKSGGLGRPWQRLTVARTIDWTDL
jgi:hypothetical protein